MNDSKGSNQTGLKLLMIVSAMLVGGCGDNDSSIDPNPNPNPPPVDVVVPVDETSVCIADWANPGYLPGDLGTADLTQALFDEFSWQTFLALNAPGISTATDPAAVSPQWSTTADQVGWSSTPDLLNLITADSTPSTYPEWGAHAYPAECQAIDGYTNYRTLEQVGKVNDSIFEAGIDGLSSNPVLDRFGNFLRYEILTSPTTYNDTITPNNYYTEYGQEHSGGINMSCGIAGTASPDSIDSGSMTVKFAWMEDPNSDSVTYDTSQYWNQELLVYTPASLLGQTGGEDTPATCEKKNFLLVGMHIGRKMISQQGWVWSTFEHKQNAPNCSTAMPKGGVNTSCPAPGAGDGSTDITSYNIDSTSDDIKYNFLPGSDVCVTNDDGTETCQSCDVAPSENCTGADTSDPNSDNTTAWCTNKPPAQTTGLSRLCRQGGPNAYPDADTVNATCQADEYVAQTRWQYYQLISTQWLGGTYTPAETCTNIALDVNPTSAQGGMASAYKTDIQPQLTLADGTTSPRLANTSMESYERSNCLGCHARAMVADSATSTLADKTSDFVYHLGVEVDN